VLSGRDEKFRKLAADVRFDAAAEIKIGGNYVPSLRSGKEVYVSGQIPRIGDKVVVVGAVGQEVSLAEAQRAARISIVRALALIQRELGTLDRVRQVLRITVYVRSAPSFTQQTEVADAASNALFEVLGDAGRHARASVGVLQLPKGAAVEIEVLAQAT
jgi:enamine deaminase RidA (YjgF/YER057c/UK114 family)